MSSSVLNMPSINLLLEKLWDYKVLQDTENSKLSLPQLMSINVKKHAKKNIQLNLSFFYHHHHQIKNSVKPKITPVNLALISEITELTPPQELTMLKLKINQPPKFTVIWKPMEEDGLLCLLTNMMLALKLKSIAHKCQTIH